MGKGPEESIMRRIYLDYNATTPLAGEVFEAMKPYLSGEFGNASSIHWYGQRAKAAVERARERVAGLIGARPNEIVFTSGGTEADNTAVFGVVEAAGGGKKYVNVISSSIEHHAVLNACKALERKGVEITYIPVGSDGVVDPEEVRRAIRPETVLISLMHANNEIGTIQPIEQIGRIAAECGARFHSDAVQSAGKLPLNVAELGADLLSLSGHKIYGPQGVGALYVRRGIRFAPRLYGGHHERDRRAGTENVAGIVGLGKAAELAAASLAEETQHLSMLRDRLEAGILSRIPQVSVNGDAQRRLPSTTNLQFDYVEGEAFVIAMDLKGIACSTGAACSSGTLEASHVMAALGKTSDQARSAIRFSLGRFNTTDDIDSTLEIIPGVVERLRSLSPRYKKSKLVAV